LKNRRSFAWLIAVVAILSLLASACGKSDSDTSSGKKGSPTQTTKAADKDKLASLNGNLNGGGSSFQDTFEQQVISDFEKEVADAGGKINVTYAKSGSSDGKKSLADDTTGDFNFAGTDSLVKDEEKANFGDRKILYFPIVGGPITVAYNLSGVKDLQLSADVIANIFQGKITTWDDPAIAKDNPDAKLPSTKITVVHRSDGSGTTSNFTKFLDAASDQWTLGSGDTVPWPTGSGFQGAEKNTGVAQVVSNTDGAIAYVDLADAAKAKLSVAKVGNAEGEFIAPTPDAASIALGGAEINDDLTYNPLNAKAKGAYPITSPTWILTYADQKSQATADALKAYLRYVLTTGQEQAKSLLYAPLPEELAKKAVDQVDQIKAG